MITVSSNPNSLDDNRRQILTQINAAAKRAGRSIQNVTLTAVSKIQPDDRIEAMLETGQRVFGENRVQEAQNRWNDRFKESRAKIELRLIGPLQSNKVPDACDLFDVIETLDREKLLKAFVKYRAHKQTLPRLLIQVNTGQEAQKSGIAPHDLSAFLALCRKTYDIHPEGLMCIPPQGEAASPHFWLLKNLATENALPVLSMGMSNDFETAVKMGATHVRLGTALFGARDYK